MWPETPVHRLLALLTQSLAPPAQTNILLQSIKVKQLTPVPTTIIFILLQKQLYQAKAENLPLFTAFMCTCKKTPHDAEFFYAILKLYLRGKHKLTS